MRSKGGEAEASGPGPMKGAERTTTHRSDAIAIFSLAGILAHFFLRYGMGAGVPVAEVPLAGVLIIGGIPLLGRLARKLWEREFGSDLLAGISIVTAAMLHQYLAGAIIVLMLSGGEALEQHALKKASSALQMLAKRQPTVAHRRSGGKLEDISLGDILVGDMLVIFPHEVCPADGVVIEGHGVMDESYLTGEPFRMTKAAGSAVISGALNGESALTVETTRRAADSRFARIMEVMRESEQKRPRLRRLGDRLGAIYTPLALGVAAVAWLMSGDATRFLSVLVIATPCPLLIAIPTAIIGSISLCAARAIVVKDPAALEEITKCRTAIFDKTGTLTYGTPELAEQIVAEGFEPGEVLAAVASLERYSKHPLARAIVTAAERAGIEFQDAEAVHEPPGQGMRGRVHGEQIIITGRQAIGASGSILPELAPETAGALECVVLIEDRLAAIYRFRDSPRAESQSFIRHLGPQHRLDRLLVVSGDRESEVRHLAKIVGISEIYAGKSPEEKLEIVRAETARAKTFYVGDGINDAPAMMAATVGIAMGRNTDVTAEAAGVVILDNSLRKVDEFIHIGRQMHAVALQSAVGGMVLSVGGMAWAVAGFLDPVSGAISQEIIDILAVLNALRAAFRPRIISDFRGKESAQGEPLAEDGRPARERRDGGGGRGSRRGSRGGKA